MLMHLQMSEADSSEIERLIHAGPREHVASCLGSRGSSLEMRNSMRETQRKVPLRPDNPGIDTGCHTVRIALEEISIEVIVAADPVRDASRAGGRFSITQTGKLNRDVAGRATNSVRIYVISPLLYEHLDKIKGQAGFEDVSIDSQRFAQDPAIDRLARALVVMGEMERELAAIYVDGICLAIVARLLSMRCDCNTPTTDRRLVALQKWRLKRVFEYIDAHLGERIASADLADVAGLTCMYFAARFRIATGVRPHEYVLRRRIERAQELLLKEGCAVVDIALSIGFQTQAHFTTVFKRFVGETPHRWRRAAWDAARAQRLLEFGTEVACPEMGYHGVSGHETAILDQFQCGKS